MIWFFRRASARLQYEIRRESQGPGYELVITYPDGSQCVECYADPATLIHRSLALQDSLIEDGWRPPALAARRPEG
jgi:hypothetical protein